MADLSIESPALGGPATVRLLTPDGWERRGSGERWPVLYLLHGMYGSHEDWTANSDVEHLRALRNVLVVMPDGGSPGGFYSNWWNGGRYGTPAWETFHLDEVASILERRYGAGTRRAVAGVSISWKWHDPYHLAGRLRHTPVFLSCGDGELGPLDGPDTTPFDQQPEAFDRVLNESLADRLRKQRVPLVTDFYPGTHQPAYWQRELHRSLPVLLGALNRRSW